VATRLLSSRRENILVLKLDSEDGYPRLEQEILATIVKEIIRISHAGELMGVVITGTGCAFAAGAEISELAKLTPAEGFEFARFGQGIMREIGQSRCPVVAAIRGYCMGGGLDLALACHARIASPDAIFAHPGGALGIITGWGGTQRLPRLIGRARALELFLTGRRIEAQEALRWGLIRAILPADDVLPAAIRAAKQLAKL
jgi:enoyl-CoA hydratase